MKNIRLLIFAFLCAVAQGALATDYSVGTDSELRAAIANDGANIIVTADIDLSNSTLSIANGYTITIDLNGHKLDRHLTQRGENGGQVITVRSGATLNLSNGIVKGGWGGDGGGLVIEGGTANLTNVTITGNTADDRGGGISNHGTINMTGGAITDNTSLDQTAPRGGGGLFNAEGATATLTNVTITGNKTTAGFGGGGICNHGTLTIDGGSITGNTAGTHGSGIWQEGTLYVQGALVVKNNLRADGVGDNLHLTNGKLLTLIGAITDSDIRVNMQNPGVFTSGYATYHSGIHPSQILIPDFLPYWTIGKNGDGEAYLMPQHEGSVSFIERSWDDVNKKVVCTRRVWEEGEYIVLTADHNDYSSSAFLYCNHTKILVRGNVEIEKRLCVYADAPVAIVLADNSHLQVQAIVGIEGRHDMSLSIYAEEGGGNLGRITTDASINTDYAYYAGIGECYDNTTAVTIHGGNIYAKGGDLSPGIGSVTDPYHERTGGDITIYGGNITAYGGSGSGGIGGGFEVPNYGNISIYGGTIYAKGGRFWSAYSSSDSGPGIGGGDDCTGGTTHIYGGNITAEGDNEGAGIGSSQTSDSQTGAGHIIIDGGHIVARGDDYAAGIGGGDGVNGNRIEINSGEVYAYGGKDAAGIGGGEGGNGGTITITGGYVYAQGGTDYGAGIGGGESGDGGNITITGGTVVAKAGKNDTGLRAIGPGAGSDNYGTLTIGDNMMVSSERLATAEERKGFCWYRTQARIEPCTHQGATYTDGGSSVSIGCSYCLTGTMPYTFKANGNWNDGSKWFAGYMPHEGKDVDVKARATIPNNCIANVGNIALQDGGSLTIADGGQLIHNNAGVTATVQKSISKYTVPQSSGETMTNGWYFIASPATNYTPKASMLSNTYDLYRLNNTTWENWKQEGDHYHFDLENSHGYLYANSEDVTLGFTGSVLPSAASQEVSVNAGFNLIGNPFLHNVYADRAYYRMNDERTGIVAVENYQENPITPCTGVIVNSDAAGTVTFLKEAPSLSNNNGSLNIVLSQVPEPVEGPARDNGGVSTGSTTATLDNAIVSFNEGNQLEKFVFNANNAKLYIPQGGKDYSIAFSEGQGEIPLNFKATENGEYTITVNPQSVDLAYLHLIDNMTGADVDLLVPEPVEGPASYTFTAKTTDYESRFKLVFSASEDADDNNEDAPFAFISNSNIIVNGTGTLQIIDVLGRELVRKELSTLNSKLSTLNYTPGVYVLRLINGDNIRTQKIIIE